MSQIFSKRYLLRALKTAGVSYSYNSLLRYEKLGVIPKAQNAIGMGTGSKWRLYTQTEIDNIVNKMIAYKKK